MNVDDLDRLGEQLLKGSYERAKSNFGDIKDQIFEEIDPIKLIDLVDEISDFCTSFKKMVVKKKFKDDDDELTETLLSFGLYLSIILKSNESLVDFLMSLPEAELELI